MNNCLADLSRLLPQASLRKGRGRIEKTEIVELAIKHLQHLQTHPCPHGGLFVQLYYLLCQRKLYLMIKLCAFV